MHNGHPVLSSSRHCTHAGGGHLAVLVLDDEPEPVAGDGHDAEGRHEDREVLPRLHELAQVLREGLRSVDGRGGNHFA